MGSYADYYMNDPTIRWIIHIIIHIAMFMSQIIIMINDPGHEHSYVDYYMNDPTNGWSEGGGSDRPTGRDRITETGKTGITVTGVTSSYRHGSETRPKNMNVIYIIRVW